MTHAPLLFPHAAVLTRCPACPPASPAARFADTGTTTPADAAGAERMRALRTGDYVDPVPVEELSGERRAVRGWRS